MDEELRTELKMRRHRVREFLRAQEAPTGAKGTALLLLSAPTFVRNGDVEHSYRQHSDFYYLTGFEEPESALLILPEDPGFVLFVRPRDPEREIWDGRRAGTDGACETYGADVAHPISELEEKLADYLENRTRLAYLLGESDEWDRLVFRTIAAVRGRRRKRVDAPSELFDARRFLHELRLHKTAYEQKRMAEVAELSAAAHRAAMRAARPHMSEWQLQNVLESEFRARWARRVAYDSIVGSGPNATILHYRESEREMQAGELVLIDAGAEKEYLAADITRTFPVSGKFTPVQRRLYEIVLAAQGEALQVARVGATLDDIHEAAVAKLEEGLRGEGLVDGEDGGEQARQRVKHFYMHRTSHYLGMDVHDVGSYHEGGRPRKLEAGMVITIEPGLYIAEDDDSVPEDYRGIGIRIEDDVLITEDGAENLTAAAPKTIEEIESACLD